MEPSTFSLMVRPLHPRLVQTALGGRVQVQLVGFGNGLRLGFQQPGQDQQGVRLGLARSCRELTGRRLGALAHLSTICSRMSIFRSLRYRPRKPNEIQFRQDQFANLRRGIKSIPASGPRIPLWIAEFRSIYAFCNLLRQELDYKRCFLAIFRAFPKIGFDLFYNFAYQRFCVAGPCFPAVKPRKSPSTEARKTNGCNQSRSTRGAGRYRGPYAPSTAPHPRSGVHLPQAARPRRGRHPGRGRRLRGLSGIRRKGHGIRPGRTRRHPDDHHRRGVP